MADEPKRSSRSSSTGGTRKGGTKPSAAASGGADTTTEAPPAVETAATAPTEAAPAQTPGGAAAESRGTETASAATTAAATPPAPPPAAMTRQTVAPPAAPPPAESSGSGGIALAGLIAGVVGIVLALTYPQWTPIVYGSSGSEKRVTADQVRAEMKGEIDALKATVAALTAQQTGLQQAIRTAKLPGILMVAEDLRSELGGSGSYAGTLNLFRSLTGDDAAAAPIIAAVEGRAEVGVPSVGDLQDSFDEAAHAVLMAEQRPSATGDLASQVSDTVASLTAATMRLRWRLDGAPSGDSVPAIVARAEQAVVNGELQLALDTLGLLPEERRSLVQPWMEMVQARMQAESVREELDAYIIATAARIQ